MASKKNSSPLLYKAYFFNCVADRKEGYGKG
jgi:hypothetical protein